MNPFIEFLTAQFKSCKEYGYHLQLILLKSGSFLSGHIFEKDETNWPNICKIALFYREGISFRDCSSRSYYCPLYSDILSRHGPKKFHIVPLKSNSIEPPLEICSTPLFNLWVNNWFSRMPSPSCKKLWLINHNIITEDYFSFHFSFHYIPFQHVK